jgi:hypothetical protein
VSTIAEHPRYRTAQARDAIKRGRATVERTRFIISHSRALLDRPRPRFSGGADLQPDQPTIHERVRGLIDAGILSRFNSGRLIAGPCRVERHCTVCGAGIKVGEQEVEIVSRTGAAVIHLHRPCLDIWTQEATDGDGPRRGDVRCGSRSTSPA